MPFWVATIIRAGSLSTSQVGWVASGEMLACAIGVLAVSAWGKHGSPRWVAAAAASVAVFSNVVSMFSAIQALIIGRLLSGLAMGALAATVIRVAFLRQGTQRVLALVQTATMLLIGILYFVLPGLIARFGLAGIFAILAAGGMVMIALALIGLPTVTTTPAAVTRAENAQKVAPIIGGLALALVCIGQSMVGIYIVTIGNGLGFDARTMGTVLAIAFPLGIVGSLAAHILGERIGLLRPLLVGLALLAIDILFLVHAASPICFYICTVGLTLWLVFCLPYAVAVLGRLDTSGRFASAAPAFAMLGGAAGPALGSRMLGTTGFQTLALVAASCIAAGIALFTAAASLGGEGVRQGAPML
jgi:predicted MFS family arabinose efflux permease